jgi:hypothetical protein
MILCQVISPWAGSGTMTDPYMPKLVKDYSTLTCIDVTDPPSTPPSQRLIVEAMLDESAFTSLQADANYTVLNHQTV